MYHFSDDVRREYENSPVPILVIEKLEQDGYTLALVSNGFLDLYGTQRNHVDTSDFGNNIEAFFDKIHPDEADKLKLISNDFLKRQTEYDITFRLRKSDGYHLIYAVGYWNTNPEGNVLAFITFTDVQKHEKVLADIAKKFDFFQKDDFYVDALTQLPNINYLNKYVKGHIEKMISEGKTPVYMYFDIDSMQSYNNKYGFERGDQLLVLVANILFEEYRHSLIARTDSDHFLVVDCFEGKQETIDKVERVNAKVKSQAYGTTTGFHVGIYVETGSEHPSESVGHAIRANKLIQDELSTIYRFYTEEDDALFHHQRYIIENFHKAMDQGYIKVFYQGFLRIETGNGMGFEALARWMDPEKGMISPSDFIPPLEKYHLMHEFDLYIFERVCMEIEPRYKAGLPILPVSINFSRQDFDYIDVVEEINRIVDKYHIEQYGIDKSFFIIEITEEGIAKATDKFHEQLKKIRENGYKLWVDDFGSGYSSLNVFSSFDIDLIKLDMNLLRNLDAHKGANRVVIKSVIDVAHTLGIHTLCEGLETEEQRQFLLDVGCELAQGFLYHKPEGLDTIFERLNIGIPIPKWETTEEREHREEKWR